MVIKYYIRCHFKRQKQVKEEPSTQTILGVHHTFLPDELCGRLVKVPFSQIISP